MVDLEAQRAHDVEVELCEQVVNCVDRAGGGVFDGQHAKLAEAVSHSAHDTFEGLEERDIGHGKELARGDLAVGALNALAGDAGSLGEGRVEGLGSGVGLLALGCAAGEIVELGALAGGVEDGLAHLDF